jgi:hypothetical protein
MWKWFNCYLSGRHDFGVWCDNGAIFLRCVHCGKRSAGISIDSKPHLKPQANTPVVKTHAAASRVLPFDRAAAR